MNTEIRIQASKPRPSKCVSLAGAVDIDVTVTVTADGEPLPEGEITLAPSQYDGSLEPYGDCPDMWVSGALLAAIQRRDDAREILAELAYAR